MSEGYEGWRNRATWCVSLWYSNDEGLYNHIRDTIRGFAQEGLTKGQARGELMDLIEDDVSSMHYDCFEAVEKIGGGFAVDLLLTPLDQMDIDYYRIADSMLEDYDTICSDSIKDTAKLVYGKTKTAAQKGVQKTRTVAGKAKARVAPKVLATLVNAPRMKVPTRMPSTRPMKPLNHS